MKNFDPLAKDSYKLLAARLAVTDSRDLYGIGLGFRNHSRRGEIVSLLDRLSRDPDRSIRLNSLTLMTMSFPDLPLTVRALTRAAGDEMSFDRFREVVEAGRGLKATRGLFLAEIIELMEPHLQASKLTFPIRESAREKEARLALGLSSLLTRFRKSLRGRSQVHEADEATRKAFGSLYESLEAELRRCGQSRKTAWQAPRSRAERIRSVLAGEEELTNELFRMMTSRDTFENLHALLTQRPQALTRYKGWLRPEGAVTDQQMKRLWDLMDDELKKKLGPPLLKKCGTNFEPATLCIMAAGPESVARDALDTILSQPEKLERMEKTRDTAEGLLSLHPSLEVPIWKVFSSVLTPPAERFPAWAYRVDSVRAHAVCEGTFLFLSTEHSLTCLEKTTGTEVWHHVGDTLPLVYYSMGFHSFLAQNRAGEIFWIERGEGLEIERLQGPNLSLVDDITGFSHRSGSAVVEVCVVPNSHYGDGKFDEYRFERATKSYYLLKEPDHDHKAWDGCRLLLQDREQMQQCLRCAPTVSVSPGDLAVYFIDHSPGVEPVFLHQYAADCVFGFDRAGDELWLRLWRR